MAMSIQLKEAAAPTGEGAQVEQPEPRPPFPPFDPSHFASQLLWFAITFAVFYLVIARVAIPRIAGILANRRGRITADLEEAERSKRAAEEAGAAYDKALADARTGAFRIAGEASERTKAAAGAERAASEADLARKLAAAEARIADIKAKALADVGAIAAEATEAVVRALSDGEVSAAEVSEAVGAAIDGRSARV
jgi:F-type H+-transporting ATPase subunit b